MSIPLFDAHCDTLYRIMTEPGQHLMEGDGHWDLCRMTEFAPQAQFFALFADSAQAGAAENVARQLHLFRRECELFQPYITACTNGREALVAADQGKIAAFLSVEGANCCTAPWKG